MVAAAVQCTSVMSDGSTGWYYDHDGRGAVEGWLPCRETRSDAAARSQTPVVCCVPSTR